MKIVALEDSPEFKSQSPKTICVKNERIFGRDVSRASGIFVKGRLKDEADIGTTDDKRYYINFVQGVPHGRMRYESLIVSYTFLAGVSLAMCCCFIPK